jgi:hypothetical protein
LFEFRLELAKVSAVGNQIYFRKFGGAAEASTATTSIAGAKGARDVQKTMHEYSPRNYNDSTPQFDCRAAPIHPKMNIIQWHYLGLTSEMP